MWHHEATCFQQKQYNCGGFLEAAEQDSCSTLISCKSAPGEVLATIWSSQSRDTDSADTDLASDPQFDDWHIIIPNEFETGSAAGCTEQTEGLSARLSTPVCNGRARYLRCGHAELPDMTAWLVWQRFEPSTIPRQLSWNLLDVESRNLSDLEISTGNSSVITLFQTRSVEQIRLVLLATYFVSVSFRRLRLSELTQAVQEAAKSWSESTAKSCNDRELLQLCDVFLVCGSDDKVVFQTPSMKKFMTRARIPGLEHGHGTMTRICFNQIRRLGTMFVLRPWTRFRKWFRSDAVFPLLRYVSKHWWSHYKLAAPSRSDLSAELCSMINTALVGSSADQTPLLLQGKVVEAGFTISQIYNLPELQMMYRNMGARGGLSLCGGGPLLRTWQNMRPAFGIRLPEQLPEEAEASVSDVFDNRSIYCIRRAQSQSLAKQLDNLHLQAADQTTTARHTYKHTSPDLLTDVPDVLCEWECLNELVDVQVDAQTPPELAEEWQLVEPED